MWATLGSSRWVVTNSTSMVLPVRRFFAWGEGLKPVWLTTLAIARRFSSEM